MVNFWVQGNPPPHPGQVDFALGQVKIEDQRPNGQVKLASVSLNRNVSLINDNFQSEATFVFQNSRLQDYS